MVFFCSARSARETASAPFGGASARARASARLARAEEAEEMARRRVSWRDTEPGASRRRRRRRWRRRPRGTRGAGILSGMRRSLLGRGTIGSKTTYRCARTLLSPAAGALIATFFVEGAGNGCVCSRVLRAAKAQGTEQSQRRNGGGSSGRHVVVVAVAVARTEREREKRSQITRRLQSLYTWNCYCLLLSIAESHKGVLSLL